MSECRCCFKLSLSQTNNVFINTEGCDTHKDAPESSFGIRAWVNVPGMLYNSYRNDTGTDPHNALSVFQSPYDNSLLTCNLTQYVEDSKEEEGVVISLNLFVDGVLTTAKTEIKYKTFSPVSEEELKRRLKDSVRASLQEKEREDDTELTLYVQKGLAEKGWLPYFHSIAPDPSNDQDGGWTLVEGLSSKFEKALDEEMVAYDGFAEAQAREKRMLQLDSTQQAQAEATFAQEQVVILRARMEELEDLRAKERRTFQAQLAELRMKLQLAIQGKHQDWMCSSCTFLNPHLKSQCSMCRAAKPGSDGVEEEKHDR